MNHLGVITFFINQKSFLNHQNMISFQIFHDKKCNHRTATSNSYRAKVELARNTKESNFQVSFTVEDQQDFENVIPENVTEAGKKIK